MIANEGENLVFLLSLPRSGSTIVSLMLGNHSHVLCPPEPWFLLKLASLIEYGSPESIFDDEQATIGTKEFLVKDGAFIEAGRAFALTIYNYHLRQAKKSIFIDKTPRYYHILPFIEELFPKAKKIWLKRNPLDVALSCKNTWGVRTEFITGQKILPLSFDLAVGLFNLAHYFNKPSPSKFEIQYEALMQSPHETLSRLCHFIGIEFEDQMLNYAQNQELIGQYQTATMGDKKALSTNTIHTQSIGKWAKELSLTEIEQIMKILGLNIFRQMGYDDMPTSLKTLGVELCSETEAAEARQRISTTNVDKIAELKQRVKNLQHRLQTSQVQVTLEHSSAHLANENRNLKQQLSQIENSRSWQLTAPLRRIVAIMRTLKNGNAT
jgi:hypothetical protein